MTLDQIAQLCLSHFLCRFDPKSRKRLTRDVVREVALEVYSSEKVDEFIDSRLSKFQTTLVEEFNQRLTDKRPLRFQIADAAGIGKIVAGNHLKKLAREIRFQNSLHRTSAADFEIGRDSLASARMPGSILDAVIARSGRGRIRLSEFGATHPLWGHARIDVDRPSQTLHVDPGDDRRRA